jgi:biotin--protein ligase
MTLAAVESTSPGPSSQPKGKAVLTSIHLEYPLAGPPARSLTRATVSDEAIAKADSERLEWFGNLLESLDLRLPGRAKPSGLAAAMGNLSLDGMTDDVEKLLQPTHPLPMFLFTNPALGSKLASDIFLGPGPISDRLEPATSGVRVLKDANDTFHLTALGPEASDVSSALVHARNTPPPAPPVVEDDGSEEANLPPNPQAVFDAMPKHIYLPSSNAISRDWTPLWDLERYWQALSQARASASRRTLSVAQTGDVLCYGEAVTSTQTMLDRNPILLNHLPTPFVSLATFQLSGRGRGSNIWLSPAGCLQFSILLDLPQSLSKHVVFVQYLMALAVCEGLDEDGRLGVRIKWPNDIYAYAEGIGGAPKGEKGRVKIGGILVNSSYTKGKFKLVVGEFFFSR